MTIQITIEDHFIPYLVLLFNVFLWHSIRRIISSLLPRTFHTLVNEIISTIELCACCAELGPVWHLHGNIGLSAALFFLCVWWCQAWDEAEACPCGPLEDILLIHKSLDSTELLMKLLGQCIGGALTWKYTTWIWCWHLTEEHHQLHEQPCEASLYVSPLYGMLIEGLITFISRIVALESGNWSHLTATVANSLTSVILVLFAMNTTGGFFNPILASALMIGCQGHTYLEHFQVYWIGALTGGLLARWMHLNVLNNKDLLIEHNKSD